MRLSHRLTNRLYTVIHTHIGATPDSKKSIYIRIVISYIEDIFQLLTITNIEENITL